MIILPSQLLTAYTAGFIKSIDFLCVFLPVYLYFDISSSGKKITFLILSDWGE